MKFVGRLFFYDGSEMEYKFEDEDGNTLCVKRSSVHSFIEREQPTGIRTVEDHTVHGVSLGKNVTYDAFPNDEWLQTKKPS
jgi:hypothetical protein